MLYQAAAAPERPAAAATSTHGTDCGGSGLNRTSFIRVQLCDRNTTIFMPFVPNVDTGASLKGHIGTLLGTPDAPLALFEMKQQQKHPLDDSLVLTAQNTDACSLWFCCPADKYDTLDMVAVLGRL